MATSVSNRPCPELLLTRCRQGYRSREARGGGEERRRAQQVVSGGSAEEVPERPAESRSVPFKSNRMPKNRPNLLRIEQGLSNLLWNVD